MKRLSSNLTILLKIFLPLLYAVFFGSFLISFFLIDEHDSPLMHRWEFRLIYSIVFFLCLALLYFTVFKIKRVDADAEHLYIGNYLKTYKYPWSDVQSIKTRNYGIFKTMRISFKAPTTFGHRISFMPSLVLIEDFIKTNPQHGQLISDAE